MKRTQMCNLESHGFYFDLMGFKIQLRIRLGLLILQVVFQSSPNRLEPASGMCVVVSQLFVMKKNKKTQQATTKGKKKGLRMVTQCLQLTLTCAQYPTDFNSRVLQGKFRTEQQSFGLWKESGHGGDGLMVGLDDLSGLFQP